jgi:hypothetical protein
MHLFKRDRRRRASSLHSALGKSIAALLRGISAAIRGSCCS